MDDNAPKENPPADFNKLDLTQLQSFSFGTQWTQDKSSPSDRREREPGSERPRRDDRRDDRRDGPGGAPVSRDRRAFRKPAGAPGSEGGPGAPAAPGASDRRDLSGGGQPRREGGGEYRGGPRRDGPGGERGGPRYAGRSEQYERGPYESPFFNATFYPEDTSFNTLVQTIRKSCRTIELFEIARTVVDKLDRFVVVVTRKTPVSGAPSAARPAAENSAAAAESAASAAKPAFYISVPDALPFESDEAAVAHVLANHLGAFFDTAEVEVDPPKGNYQVINKCGVTSELLGPPNYHRYNQIVQQHHAAKVARMAFEAFRSRIETVRDPEIVNQWMEKMKKTTRYTWNPKIKAKPAAAPTTAAAAPVAPALETSAPAAAVAEPAEAPAAAPVTEAPVVAPALSFDSLEEARTYLLTQARDKVVRTSDTARFHGKIAETMPPGEIRRAVEGALERQRKFPLDTANALRGRLRREHFTIFKKGSKGVSYVCAVKRKFRVPDQTFADSIGALISFIEANPMMRASELPRKFLGFAPAAPAAAPAAPAETPPKIESTLSVDDRAKISRLQGDLTWLVREGYVTEFIDGRLFAPPPVVEARKKEAEAEEHDPENFPDAPVAAPPDDPVPAPAPAATETPPPVAIAEATPAVEPPVAPATDEPKPAAG
ncbi:MAG: hypothetical protein EXS32_12985 [Opitutus sp.]|nr:hypothetical protein [Opitutus sp.]